MIYTDTIIRDTMKESRVMTVEEAIGCLDLIKTDATQINEAIDMAIEALEKQVEKKPIKSDRGNHLCCICKNEVFYDEYDTNKINTELYCPNCGQKLDWN